MLNVSKNESYFRHSVTSEAVKGFCCAKTVTFKDNRMQKTKTEFFPVRMLVTELSCDSQFQNISVSFDEDGCDLKLNGRIQRCRDEQIMQRFVHMPLCALLPPVSNIENTPKLSVCVLGGGDGSVLYELLKYEDFEVNDIVVVDIDQLVFQVCCEYDPSTRDALLCGENNVSFFFCNAQDFVEAEHACTYDAVYIDIPDTFNGCSIPEGPHSLLDLDRLLANVERILKPGGIMVSLFLDGLLLPEGRSDLCSWMQHFKRLNFWDDPEWEEQGFVIATKDPILDLRIARRNPPGVQQDHPNQYSQATHSTGLNAEDWTTESVLKVSADGNKEKHQKKVVHTTKKLSGGNGGSSTATNDRRLPQRRTATVSTTFRGSSANQLGCSSGKASSAPRAGTNSPSRARSSTPTTPPRSSTPCQPSPQRTTPTSLYNYGHRTRSPTDAKESESEPVFENPGMSSRRRANK